MNRIIDSLWITDIDGARNNDTSGFDTVVTVCQDSIEDNVSDDQRYYHFNLADGGIDAYGGECSYELFSKATSVVFSEVWGGNTTLVHCHVGKSRSAAVCIAVYAVLHDVSYGEARTAVEDARPIINPDDVLESYAKQFIETHQA